MYSHCSCQALSLFAYLFMMPAKPATVDVSLYAAMALSGTKCFFRSL